MVRHNCAKASPPLTAIGIVIDSQKDGSMRSQDGDAASFKFLGLMAVGLSAALFVLLALLGTGGFHITI